MKKTLQKELLNLIGQNPKLMNTTTAERFRERIPQGLLTRDENPVSHFCVYTLPFNPKTNEVFLIHHKKSGLWIFPGGHIDKGENLIQTRNREAFEELGVKLNNNDQKPFMFSVCDIIPNPNQTCCTHFDTWYLVETDGSDFNVDPEEFFDTRWMTVEEAEKIVVDPSNRLALENIKMEWHISPIV